MTIDPQAVFVGLMTVVGLAAGIEFGMAFLMRGEREATSDD